MPRGFVLLFFLFVARDRSCVFYTAGAKSADDKTSESSSAQHSRAQFSDAFVYYCFSFFFLFFASFVSAFVCRPKPRRIPFSFSTAPQRVFFLFGPWFSEPPCFLILIIRLFRSDVFFFLFIFTNDRTSMWVMLWHNNIRPNVV